ncbi:tautomerase family protein [Streptomyces sp. Ru71]|uniref:tautomerase family protein n=1 Tax=Streptomyces sp. Ru71 TaxID=2080746 RepID=UPI000CDD8E98|nr:tautomerase family protein [Streptomyces sp. Ru71]POX44461.1 tautomerase family protein [Streptomyces sp. Ru71]
MPLVRIDTLGPDTARLHTLGDAVHQALMDTLGIPPEDRFQILTAHDGKSSTLRHGAHLGIPHDDDIALIAVTLRAGRTTEQKQNLYRRITELAGALAGVEPRNVVITLYENTSPDWSFGHGEAQYVTPAV